MTKAEALVVARMVAAYPPPRVWSEDSYRVFVGILLDEKHGEPNVSFAVAEDAAKFALTKYGAATEVRHVLQEIRARRSSSGSGTPPPGDETGAAERPIYFPPDSGREPFPVARPDEDDRERMRQFYADSAQPATLQRRDLGIRREHVVEALAKADAALAALREREATAHLNSDELAALAVVERKHAELRYELARRDHRVGIPVAQVRIAAELLRLSPIRVDERGAYRRGPAEGLIGRGPRAFQSKSAIRRELDLSNWLKKEKCRICGVPWTAETCTHYLDFLAVGGDKHGDCTAFCDACYLVALEADDAAEVIA